MWKEWLYHLLSAGIAGAANSTVAAFVAPSAFNVTSAQGWEHIGALALVGFIVPVLAILKNGLPSAQTT